MSKTRKLYLVLRSGARKYRKSYLAIKGLWFWTTIFPTIILIMMAKLMDVLVPKDPHLWIFPANFYTHDFSDNSRAIFESVKRDHEIHKIILARSKEIPIPDSATSTRVFPMLSIRSLGSIFRAKVLFVEHSLYLDFAPLRMHNYFFFALFRRKVINIWHGAPIKSLEGLSDVFPIRGELRHHHVVASSTIDKRVMADALFPVVPKNVHATGIPRNDFLVRAEELLPDYYTFQLRKVRATKGDKRLLLYAPTYRDIQAGASYYDFSADEVNRMKGILSDNNAMLALRMHPHNRAGSLFSLVDGKNFIDFDQVVIPDLSMILRETDVVITDYSGLVVDAIYLARPAICFAYDRAQYSALQLGFIYPLDLVFATPICSTFNELCDVLEAILVKRREDRLEYCDLQKIFFEHTDDRNSERVVELVRTLVA